MPDDTPDPVADLLRRSPLANDTRAKLWDAYYQSSSPDDFASRIKDIPVTYGKIRADLYDLKSGQQPSSAPVGGDLLLENLQNLGHAVVSHLPVIGGIVGGVAGGLAGGPPGAIAGATLGGAAGEGYRQTAQALVGQPVTTSTTGAIGRMAGEAALQGGAEALGAGGAAVMKPAAEAIMQSALKPGLRAAIKSVRAGDTPAVVKTLLDEGVNVTPAGVAKLNQIINATQGEITNAISSVPFDVNPYKVASRLGDTAQTFARQVNPEADLAAVGRVGNEFLQNYGGQPIPGQVAQGLKTGTYTQLGNKAYTGELKGAEVESQKALARGLKEEIVDEFNQTLPGIKGQLGLPGGIDISAANAREGQALAALDAVARRVAVGGNNNPLGLASLAVSHPITFLTTLIDRNPAVKSMLARGLYSSAGAATRVNPQLIRLALSAVAASGSEPTPTTGAPTP